MKRPPSMPTHVALLRGINVGGHRKLPMAELRELCLALGWKDVRTYIQSGNVVFRAQRPDPDALAASIRDSFGFDVPVILRSAGGLIAARDRSPWLSEAATSKNVHVMFLSRKPAAGAIARLDSDFDAGQVAEKTYRRKRRSLVRRIRAVVRNRRPARPASTAA